MMWKRTFFALAMGALQLIPCISVVSAAVDSEGCTPDSVLFEGNSKPWYPGEPLQWADQRLLDSLIGTDPDGFKYNVESPRSKGYLKLIQYLKSPEGRAARFVEGDMRHITYDGGPNMSKSIVVGHNYYAHHYWFKDELHFQSGRANWFKHSQRLYHAKNTGEIEIRTSAEAPKGAENAVVFSNDTASFFILLSGHLEDATAQPEVHCLPHRSSHWQNLGLLHSGIQRLVGNGHGISLQDYIIILSAGAYLVIRKSDLYWTEAPSALAQFRSNSYAIYRDKSPNTWIAWKGNTAEFQGPDGKCTEDFSKVVQDAEWSPLIVPHPPGSYLSKLLNKLSLQAVILALLVGAAILLLRMLGARNRYRLPPPPADGSGPLSHHLLPLLKQSKKKLTCEELDLLIGLADIPSPETRRSRRARIIQLVNTESTARFGQALLVRTRLESDKRIVIYDVQDLSQGQ